MTDEQEVSEPVAQARAHAEPETQAINMDDIQAFQDAQDEAANPNLTWDTQKVAAPKSHGWTYPGVFILTSIAMGIVMASDALITGNIGLISNIGILALSVIAATQVRTIDYPAAIWSPPLAWVFALLTGGQFGLTMSGSLLRKELFHFAYGLANHAVWILGAVLLSATIAIVRHGRRS